MNKRRWIIVLIMIGIMISRRIPIQASIRKYRIALNMSGLTYNNNGGTVKLKSGKTKEWFVNFNTMGERKGSYTTCLYINQQVKIESDSVITIRISTKKRILMNVDIVFEPNQKSYKCEEGTSVFIKRKGDQQYESISVLNGVFEIPQNFSGTLYIPVKEKRKSLRAYGVGIAVILSEKEKTEFVLESMEITKGCELRQQIFYSEISHEGQEIIQIPVRGEYYYRYCVKQDTNVVKNVRFVLAKPVEGIRMEPDGKLTIQDSAKPQAIDIIVEMGQILQYKFSIILVFSWIKEAQGVDVSNFDIPDSAGVKHVDGQLVIPYQSLRITCFMLGVTFGIFYFMCIRRERRG